MKTNLLKVAVSALGMATLVLSAGCSNGFLNEVQTTDLDKETVFADSTYTAGFLSGIYDRIHFDVEPERFAQGGLQTACDESEFKVSANVSTDVMFATGTISAQSVTDDAWRICYRYIRRCNIFLENADKSPMTEAAKKEYKAEARFLRAWYYFILLRHYGGVPLLGDKVYTDKEDIPMNRATFEETCNFIINEATQASLDLPVKRVGRQFGRASAGACRGLIARLRLYMASPLYNGGAAKLTQDPKLLPLLGFTESKQERWKEAMDAALSFLSYTQYKLYRYHRNALKSTDERGWGFYAQFVSYDCSQYTSYEGETYSGGATVGEILAKMGKLGWDHERAFYPPTGGGNGSGGYPYHEMAEMFPMKDGKPIAESAYQYDVLNPTKDRDPRYHNTIMYNGAPCRSGTTGYESNKIYTYDGFGSTQDAWGQGTRTGYYTRKATNRELSNNYFVDGNQNYIVMRYAEMLLNYAEAANEWDGPNHEDDTPNGKISPYEVLKKIRERGGIEPGADGMYGLKAGMSKDEMREAIRLERQLELAFEGYRFFDIRRWMIGESQNKAFHGLHLTRAASGTITYKIATVREHVWRDAMYYWPLPYNEVVRSEELLQNPGY